MYTMIVLEYKGYRVIILAENMRFYDSNVM